MDIELWPVDPFVARSRVCVVEATGDRAVVEQRQRPELDNHVGVRHASALYAAVYEASRALVLTTLGDARDRVQLRLVDSAIDYKHMPLGRITSTAEPSGGPWSSLGDHLASGTPAALGVVVTSANEDGRTVATLRAQWRVSPAPSG